MINRVIIFFVFFLFINTGFSEVNNPNLKVVKNKAAYPFLLHIPSNLEPNIKPPIIIFLHGRSLSGTNLNLVRRYGVINAIERGKNIPAIVVAPQVKRRESWNPEKVLSVLEYVQKNYDTDLTRVYVVGMSLGGYGTLHFAGKYPDRIAAAVALCGGGNIIDACNLGKTNIWIQHGKRDRAVPYSESVKIYNAIKSCNPKGNAILTLFPRLGHSELAREFFRDDIYNWIFQYQLPDSSAEIVRNSFPLRTDNTLLEEVYSDSLFFEENNENSLFNDTQDKNEVKVHRVKKGETLSSIAQKYKTSVSKLVAINKIKPKSKLQIGQRIRVN